MCTAFNLIFNLFFCSDEIETLEEEEIGNDDDNDDDYLVIGKIENGQYSFSDGKNQPPVIT